MMRVKSQKCRVVFPSAQKNTQRPLQLSKPRQRLRMASSEESSINGSDIEQLTLDDRFPISELGTLLSPIKDALVTPSTVAQDEVTQLCLPYLKDRLRTTDIGRNNLSRLDRKGHIRFLEASIENAAFVAFDASRPWVIYWCLTALSLLGEDVEVYRER